METTITQGEVLTRGEKIYFDKLKEKLEQTHFGEYAVIDIDSGKYVTNADKIEAIDTAKEFFGDKQFYMVQIGYLNEPTVNFRERKNVAWIF